MAIVAMEHSHLSKSPTAAPSTWTRVIALSPPPPAGRGISETLKAQFAARDWFAIEQHDPYLAMAELCLREKTQATRATWGLHRLEHIAIVILQPEHWFTHADAVMQMIAAIERHLPSATVWQADDDVLEIRQIAGPPERPDAGDATDGIAAASQAADIQRAQPNRARTIDGLATKHVSPPMPHPRPPVRLADHGGPRGMPQPISRGDHDDHLRSQCDGDGDDDVQDALASARLTRQEIEMLLDDSPENKSKDVAP